MYFEPNNILDFIKSYFISLNINHDELAIFNSTIFENCCIMKLPEVCIVSENRNTRSHQSHIHITGNNMSLFFSKEQLTNAEEISYKNQAIVLSLSNISALNHLQSSFSTLDLTEATARKKLALRKDGSIQVQLGERRNDSVEFNNLRKGLYEDDLLVILKYKNENKLFILGIPHSFYGNKNYSIKKGQDYFEIQSDNDTILKNDSTASFLDKLADDLSIDIQDTIYQDQIQKQENNSIVSPILTYNLS